MVFLGSWMGRGVLKVGIWCGWWGGVLGDVGREGEGLFEGLGGL